MIFKHLGVAARVTIRPRSVYRELKKRPTLHRDRFTAHEEGCGGVWFNVTYGTEDLGEIRSAWSVADGVHWQALAGGMTVVDPGETRPKAYPDRVAAINALLERVGWAGTYSPEPHRYDFIGRKVG